VLNKDTATGAFDGTFDTDIGRVLKSVGTEGLTGLARFDVTTFNSVRGLADTANKLIGH